MNTLQELFSSGRIVDAILVLVVAEAAALLFYKSRTGRGIPPAQLAANLAAGASLLLALRTSLAHESWTATAFWLFLGLVSHVADLYLRWR